MEAQQRIGGKSAFRNLIGIRRQILCWRPAVYTQMADEDEDDRDELNVQSEKFNALHALYSTKTVVPFPSAPVLDNVAKATSLLKRNQDLVNTPKPAAKQRQEAKCSTSAEATATAETETKTGAKKKPNKNVLTRMEEMKGPLAFLKTCMEKRIRVKVWTRTARGIRGYCLGFVVAFDKHWNLVLEDVREVWSRRVKRKQFLLGEANEMPLAWKAMGPMVRPPKVVVTRGRRGTERCERHVAQMLMRVADRGGYRGAFNPRGSAGRGEPRKRRTDASQEKRGTSAILLALKQRSLGREQMRISLGVRRNRHSV